MISYNRLIFEVIQIGGSAFDASNFSPQGISTAFYWQKYKVTIPNIVFRPIRWVPAWLLKKKEKKTFFTFPHIPKVVIWSKDNLKETLCVHDA